MINLSVPKILFHEGAKKTVRLACVAGRRKRVRKVKMSAGSEGEGTYRDPHASVLALHARLSPFPPLRTPATQATVRRDVQL